MRGASARSVDTRPRRSTIARVSRSLEDLENLGPASARWLREVDIATADELQRVGAVQAFARVRAAGLPASMNLLYALHGALTGVPWNRLDEPTREHLRTQATALETP